MDVGDEHRQRRHQQHRGEGRAGVGQLQAGRVAGDVEHELVEKVTDHTGKIAARPLRFLVGRQGVHKILHAAAPFLGQFSVGPQTSLAKAVVVGMTDPPPEQLALVWNVGWSAAVARRFSPNDYAFRVANLFRLSPQRR